MSLVQYASRNPEVIISGLSAFFTIVLTGMVGFIGWRIRSAFREFQKNTAARKYLLGDESVPDDDGFRDDVSNRFDEMHSEMQEEHAEVRTRLQDIEEGMSYVIRYVREISRAINRSDIEEEVREPPERGNWRSSND